LVLSTGTALAQTYPPPTGAAPSVEAVSGGTGGTAFTGAGSTLEVALIVATVLAVLGVVALYAVRRNADLRPR
jgi:ABC-type spermidine/putrescine transport system permease subunit II